MRKKGIMNGEKDKNRRKRELGRKEGQRFEQE